MEASETPTPDPTEVEPTDTEDPFADVPADPTAGGEGEPLPPGVEQGTLAGDNPSQEHPTEEPEEGEPLPPEDPVPAEEEPVEAPEEPTEPAAEVEPSPDPEDEEQPESPSEEVTPLPDEEPEVEAEQPETEPQPEPETEVPDKEETTGASPSATEDPEPEKPKRSRRRSSPKKGKDDREYVVLKQTGKRTWEEAFAQDAKGEHLKTGKKDEPTVVVARNGESALRRAYKLLADHDNPSNYVLVATPSPYFRPKKVDGRVHKQTAISIS